ncbi:MAG: peptide deformylase [Patescibacteria group bacterium]|jgi:peptide deformylase
MPIIDIITLPNPILRKKAVDVKLEEIPGLKKFISSMEKTMLQKDGIGLAANQVNSLKRIITINTKDGPLCLINPKIYYKSFKKEDGEEGCLSIPGIFGYVKRHLSLRLYAYDKNGQKIKIKAKGLLARVMQHEVDHLNGILFIDRAKKYSKGKKPDDTKSL